MMVGKHEFVSHKGKTEAEMMEGQMEGHWGEEAAECV